MIERTEPSADGNPGPAASAHLLARGRRRAPPWLPKNSFLSQLWTRLKNRTTVEVRIHMSAPSCHDGSAWPCTGASTRATAAHHRIPDPGPQERTPEHRRDVRQYVARSQRYRPCLSVRGVSKGERSPVEIRTESSPINKGSPSRHMKRGAYSAYGAFSAQFFGKPTHEKGAYHAYHAFHAQFFGKPSPQVAPTGKERVYRALSPRDPSPTPRHA